MSESDFKDISRNGALCNERGEIGLREFETIVRTEARQKHHFHLSTSAPSTPDAFHALILAIVRNIDHTFHEAYTFQAPEDTVT
jgi:hypothetical protein